MRFAAALCLLEKDPEPWFPDATLGRYKRQIAIERAKAIWQGLPISGGIPADGPGRRHPITASGAARTSKRT